MRTRGVVAGGYALLPRALAVVALLSVLSVSAAAQSPVVPPAPPPPPPPPPRTEFAGDFSFVGTSGNASTESLGLGAEYVQRPQDWELRGKVGYIRSHSDSELTAESTAVLLRATHTVSRRVGYFGEYNFLRDRFAGVASRHDVVGGVSYLFLDTARQQCSGNVGLGYSNEQRLVGDDLSNAIWTSGENYRAKLSDTAEFTDDLVVNQALSDAGDWRIAHVAALSAKLTSVFSLRVSSTVRYVHQPVAGFETTDTVTAIALVARLKSTP
jgi:putative salt-induced outer membrane protein YdiY